MNITVKEELRIYIDPLTPEEHEALERSLLAEGCRDALVLWGDILVDGHNRYGICQKHGIAFNTVQHPHFKSMDDVHLWMIDQHLGRRSVSDFQRGVLALRKKDILAARAQAQAQPKAAGGAMPGMAPSSEASPTPSSPLPPSPPSDEAGSAPWEGGAGGVTAGRPATEGFHSREAMARAARISSTTIGQIEKIQKTAAPELVAAVKAGEISINAAAAVASLPLAEQVAAAAGGRKELRQAARQVREAKAQARAAALGEMPAAAQPMQPASEAAPEAVPGATEEDDALPPDQLIARLRQTIAALRAENTLLRARLAEASMA